MVMIGPHRGTVKFRGKAAVMAAVNLSRDLLAEAGAKNEGLEDRDQVRIWIEKIGIKTPARKNAFGKFNKGTPDDEAKEDTNHQDE